MMWKEILVGSKIKEEYFKYVFRGMEWECMCIAKMLQNKRSVKWSEELK